MQQIVMLDSPTFPQNPVQFNYLFRLVVPVGMRSQYANRTSGSNYAGASTEEDAAIVAGQYVEQPGVYTGTGPTATWALAGSPTGTAQVKADLITAYTLAQKALNGSAPWPLFGAGYDGASWSV